MEVKVTAVLTAVVAAMMLVESFALPMGQNGQPNQDALPAEKRPKYLETRDMAYLKEVILASLVELIDEGIVSPKILTEPKINDEAPTSAQKRGRHIGVCFHLTPSGHPTPKICWKDDYN